MRQTEFDLEDVLNAVMRETLFRGGSACIPANTCA